MSKFGRGTWGNAKKGLGGGGGRTLVYDPGLTPQLVQVHDLGPQAEISTWDT